MKYTPFIPEPSARRPIQIDFTELEMPDLSVSGEQQQPEGNKKIYVPDLVPKESLPAPADATRVAHAVTPGKLTLKDNVTLSSQAQEIADYLASQGFNFTVTSGNRNSRTSSGKTSRHASGDAFDIVPTDGNWEAFHKALRGNSSVGQWLHDKGWHVLDETDPAVLQKTGGTGAHLHIGRDSS